MRCKIPVGLAIFLGCALSAYANIVFNEGPLLTAPIALIAEAVIVVKLLGARGFSFSKTILPWFMINLVTCGLMNLALAFWGFTVLDAHSLPFIIGLLVFEVVVILVEAGIILWMSRSERFREPGRAFGPGQALAISLIGNLVSFGIGLLGSPLFLSSSLPPALRG